jgi:hypothetical protein
MPVLVWPRRRFHRSRSGALRSAPRRLWSWESLEERITPAPVFTVDTLLDESLPAAITLRVAIILANNNPGSTIEFDPSLFTSGPGTIQLNGALPDLSADVTIMGPGASMLTVKGGGSSSDFSVFTVDSGVTAGLSGLTISGGHVSNYGGGIFNSGTLTLTDSIVSGNTATAVGGGILSIGTLTLTRCTLSTNVAQYGGGLFCQGGTSALIDSTFSGNTSTFAGGGIDQENPPERPSTMTLTGCTLVGNTSEGGGAISSQGTLALTNSTVYGNTASYGGGIAISGSLTLTNTTIAGNRATGTTSGGIDIQNGSTVLFNSLVAGNFTGPSGTTASDINGRASSSSANNLIGTGGSGGLTDGMNQNLVGVSDPGLGPLADNGGPTQTVALLAGSPAVDAGSVALAVDPAGQALPFDQRGTGFPRTVNGTVDIGAFQAQSVATQLVLGGITVRYGGTTTLTATLTAGGRPVAGQSVEFLLAGNSMISSLGTAVTDAGGVATLPGDALGQLGVRSAATVAALFRGRGSFEQSEGFAPVGVLPATLFITANDLSMTYGGALPSLTASYEGFVNGDTPASLTTQPMLSTVPASSPVGTYAIDVSGAVDPNYTIFRLSGTLSITPAPLTITADSKTMTYGGAFPRLTASYQGLVNGDTPASLTTAPAVSATANLSHVGIYGIDVSNAVGANYTISYVPGTLTITPASLTIRADDQSMTYGGALPSLTASYSGFVRGDTFASLTKQPMLSTPATSSSPVGTYPITASGAVDANYTITYVPGTLTITPAALTITVDRVSKVYGAPLPGLGVSYAGFVNGDTPSSLATAPTLSATATSSAVGTYPITASGAVDANYTITYVPGTLTVTPAPLTITADDRSMTYGGSLPGLTASYAGFVNGDTPASLTTAPTLSTVASSSPVGTYPIMATGGVDPNYTIRYVPGVLTITPASLTITADSKTMTYGGPLPALTASYAGFVNGDTPSSLTTAPTLGAVSAASPAGIYAITATGAVDPNYTISYAAGMLTIAPAPLTVAANGAHKVYGAALPSLTVSYVGFVNGDTPASLTTAPALGTPATSSSPVGAYAITAMGAVDPNYVISYTPGTLTITPAVLTVTPDGKMMTYGGALPPLTASYVGFVNADTPASLTTAPTLTTVAASSHVGMYAITATGAVDPNYVITYVPGALTITPAPLKIAADSKAMTYGGPMPPPTASYHGLVNGDAPGVVKGLVLGTAAATSHVGVYPITASGGSDADYTISFAAGTLTITPASLTITADKVTMPFGGAVPALTTRYSGLVNGDTPASLASPLVLSTLATSNSPSGNYPIKAAGAASPDYAIALVDGTLTVAPFVPPADARGRAGAGFVMALYREILGRGAAPLGLQYWQGRLLAGATQLDVARSFWTSPERLGLDQSARAPKTPLATAYADAMRAGRLAARRTIGVTAFPSGPGRHAAQRR